MLTKAKANRLFRYTASTGKLYWRVARPPNVRAGDEAGCIHPWTGYVVICLEKKMYYAHRIAWLLKTGKWPKKEIDHRNRRRADNRWTNLRDVGRMTNAHNVDLSKPLRPSESGRLGVHRNNKHNPNASVRWRASIMLHGKRKSVGTFATIEEASQAYQRAKVGTGACPFAYKG